MFAEVEHIFDENIKNLEQAFETKRMLQADQNYTKPFVDTNCNQIDEQDQCNSGINCTWCESNQQPPGCFLLASSVKLPPKIYQCDKQPGICGILPCQKFDAADNWVN